MDRHHDQTNSGPFDNEPTQPGIEEQLVDQLAIPGYARPTVLLTPRAHQPGCLPPKAGSASAV